MISVAPAYNLPAIVGSVTLALDALILCRMWRGNITHWSARSCGNKGRLGRAAGAAAHQAAATIKIRAGADVLLITLVFLIVHSV